MSLSSEVSDTFASKETSATTSARVPTLSEKDKEKPKSKGKILEETPLRITTLASTYTSKMANHNGLIELKMEVGKKRCLMFITKNKSMRMNDLIILRDEGFYTLEQFWRERQQILDSTQ